MRKWLWAIGVAGIVVLAGVVAVVYPLVSGGDGRTGAWAFPPPKAVYAFGYVSDEGWRIEDRVVSLEGEEVLTLPETAFVAAAVTGADGRLYFSDYGRKAVYCLARDGTLAWEAKGERGFVIPSDAFPIAFNPDRTELWVANTGMKELQRLDTATGRFVAVWKPVAPFPGCCNPIRFTVLEGDVFVCYVKPDVGTPILYGPDGKKL